MEIRQLAELAEMEVLCLCAPDREIKNIFCGDLLSWTMGRAQEGACWCTVMGNLNTIAVASLKEAACVVLCEGAECPPEVAQRAGTVGVNLLRCPLPEFETALLAARAAGLVSVKGLRYDLHLHSCLSPCGDEEMTPASIAGMAHLCGAQIIALSDHNSAENLPAAAEACRRYGLLFLPAIELNTAEEIHLLGYFPTVEAALDMGREVYRRLPPVPCREEIFGSQVIMDSGDREIGRVEKLLINAADLSLERAVREIADRGGVAVPAHLDRDSYSALSVLGILPEEPHFSAVELHDMAAREDLERAGRLPVGLEVLSSSDAHYLWHMREKEELYTLDERSALWPLVRALPGFETVFAKSPETSSFC